MAYAGKTSSRSRSKNGQHGKGNPPARSETRSNKEVVRAPRREAVKPLIPQTENQNELACLIREKILTFAIGWAGTGKTFVSIGMAAAALASGTAREFLVIRPMVTAGENPGFLPGELEEKTDPYFTTVKSILSYFLGAGYVNYAIEKGRIRLEPVAFLRSATFDNMFVLVEEAQNLTQSQMKLILSRCGKNTTYVIAGDEEDQTDLPKGQKSGLMDAVHRFRSLPTVGVVEFGLKDIVRSGFCRDVVERYRPSWKEPLSTDAAVKTILPDTATLDV